MNFPSIAPIERLHRRLVQPSDAELARMAYDNPFWRPELEEPIATADAASDELPPDASEDANAPPLIVPPTRDVRGEVRRLLLPMFEELAKLDDPELKDRCSSLRQELSEVSSKLGDFLTEAREQKIVRLTTEHTAAADACRTQKKIVEAAEQRLNEHQGEIRKTNVALSQARAKFDAVIEREPRPDTWPTAAEMHHWRTQRDRAHEELNKASEVQGKCFETGRTLLGKLTTEKEKLDKLAANERVLRARLAGMPYTDPEYNLVHPAEF